MTTDKQVEANRINGQMGGVKTEEGKLVSRYNAVRHGLLCNDILLADESREELNELAKNLNEQFQPIGQFETILVERIVSSVWRLRRALKVEQEMTTNLTEGSFSKTRLGRAFEEDFNYKNAFEKFMRYETSIERIMYRALHELQRMQAFRLGQDVPLPISVDVDISKE